MTATSEGRTENAVQIIILLIVGGMAGAASFTHVHDWTMHNTPPGTGSWFGWANAIISELTPTAAGIEIRRRKRQNRRAAYPTAVLIAAAALSLAAQVAQAKHSLTGWLLAAVPALAFLALTKLIFSRNPARTTQPQPPPAAAPVQAVSAPAADQPDDTTTGQLLLSARMAAFAHQQATGQPITTAALASHLNIPPTLAGTLLDHLDGAPPSVTAINGAAPGGGRP
jgi:Protein of unknown function (DUF2637)